ncbi:MOSC domain-containing protein YiiM [Agromyces terreus]|uniref:MOSC domain-containing protein YiiM n=1 Tax=Agromyces terreus TaxID=424795 RepID=A0A9X2KB16_9MICO|nr:MOSC domain-containing protein [Agromyces terreus]MCP2369866.1 MOSC domain-containing protein YiiM [Agromyces terreus]
MAALDDALTAPASVASVSMDDAHRFSKPTRDEIRLVTGLGVEGDAHFGETVQHLSRVRRDPTSANLRQVHLIHAELLDELAADGYDVAPGALGENVLTRGVDLLGLPRGTRLRIGGGAEVEITGLRNPCTQIDQLGDGLMKRLVSRDDDGEVVRLAGVMAVVLAGGEVLPGDPITVTLPDGEHEPLQPV